MKNTRELEGRLRRLEGRAYREGGTFGGEYGSVDFGFQLEGVQEDPFAGRGRAGSRAPARTTRADGPGGRVRTRFRVGLPARRWSERGLAAVPAGVQPRRIGEPAAFRSFGLAALRNRVRTLNAAPREAP